MNYDRIYQCDFVNGLGARVVLFVTGCLHKCPGCYNKSTWNPVDGSEFTEQTIEKIFSYLDSSYIQGLTLSGGDPMYPSNRPIITDLAKRVKERFPKKDIWLWTGYKFEELSADILDFVDVVIDGKYEEKNKTEKPWRGSANQRLWMKSKLGWSHD